MFATGETVGLAEWIIDDTCLVDFVFEHHFLFQTPEERDDYSDDNAEYFNISSSDSYEDLILLEEPITPNKVKDHSNAGTSYERKTWEYLEKLPEFQPKVELSRYTSSVKKVLHFDGNEFLEDVEDTDEDILELKLSDSDENNELEKWSEFRTLSDGDPFDNLSENKELHNVSKDWNLHNLSKFKQVSDGNEFQNVSEDWNLQNLSECEESSSSTNLQLPQSDNFGIVATPNLGALQEEVTSGHSKDCDVIDLDSDLEISPTSDPRTSNQNENSSCEILDVFEGKNDKSTPVFCKKSTSGSIAIGIW